MDARHAVLTFRKGILLCEGAQVVRIASLDSEAYYTINDALPGGGRGIWDNVAGLYKTKDGYVRIHTNFPQ